MGRFASPRCKDRHSLIRFPSCRQDKVKEWAVLPTWGSPGTQGGDWCGTKCREMSPVQADGQLSAGEELQKAPSATESI